MWPTIAMPEGVWERFPEVAALYRSLAWPFTRAPLRTKRREVYEGLVFKGWDGAWGGGGPCTRDDTYWDPSAKFFE